MGVSIPFSYEGLHAILTRVPTPFSRGSPHHSHEGLHAILMRVSARHSHEGLHAILTRLDHHHPLMRPPLKVISSNRTKKELAQCTTNPEIVYPVRTYSKCTISQLSCDLWMNKQDHDVLGRIDICLSQACS